MTKRCPVPSRSRRDVPRAWGLTLPNCDFYALGEDLHAVIGFVYSNPGWRLIELSSEPERELREFSSAVELFASYPEVGEQATSLHLQLYCESMRGQVRHRRIDLNPGAIPGATFRYSSEGWGLIQLYFGILRDGRLAPSHTNHNSARRAAAWESLDRGRLGPVSAWDWDEVARISRRLNRFIHAAAKEKEGSRPVLPVAQLARSAGRVAFALT